MPGSHIALLRGINVGRAKRVAMADLRSLVAELGYQDVRTLLNRGNIVFTVPRSVRGGPAARIEAALADRLGFSAAVTVLTSAELAAIIRDNPLGTIATDPSRFLVGVPLDAARRAKLVDVGGGDWAPERVAMGSRALYLWCPTGIIDSPLLAAVNRALGTGYTARNWNTVVKLQAMVNE
jgi:uncharacterized protein (DUF1697 family)